MSPDDGPDLAARLRDLMVERQLRARGIADERVLAAMRDVPREAFAAGADQRRAPVSSQLVPDASDISDTCSPVSQRRK